MGSCSYGRKCWCAYWYLPNAEYKAGRGDANRGTLEGLVRSGKKPGLIVYVDDRPAACVSVAPRRNFDRLNRSRNFAPIDDREGWAVNCFVVAPEFRRQGLMVQLADAAAAFALKNGAYAAEAYPLKPGPKTTGGDLYI